MCTKLALCAWVTGDRGWRGARLALPREEEEEGTVSEGHREGSRAQEEGSQYIGDVAVLKHRGSGTDVN